MSKITLHEQTSTPATPSTDKQSLYVKADGLYLVDDTGTATKVGPSSSSGVWGSITGTITDQTDLMTCFSGKQNTITTGTTSQYFRGDLSLATFPTNVSSFSNDAGYLTAESDPIYSASSWFSTTNNSGNWNTAYGWGNHASAGYLTAMGALYDLSDVGATAPSTGCVLGWTGSAWDAVPAGGSLALDDLTDVTAPTPTDGQVLTWNNMAGYWEPQSPSAGAVNFGNCNEIPFMNATSDDFCYANGFIWKDGGFEVWACGIYDPDYCCHVRRAYDGIGMIDTYFRPNPACQIFKFGFFDGENPYWGLDSAPCATSWNTNQWLRFTDYCSSWANDGAGITISDADNSISMSFMCGFNIAGGGGTWAIGYCSMEPCRVMINCQYYLPACAPSSGQYLGYCSMSGQPEWITISGGMGSPAGGQYAVQLDDGMGSFCGSSEFQYDYSCHKTIWNEYMGNGQLDLHVGTTCVEGWVFCSRDCMGMGNGYPVTFILDALCCYPFRVQSNYYCNNNITLEPHNTIEHFNHTDGMCCWHASVGYGACNSFVMQKDCMGSHQIGYNNTDNLYWTLNTYNDFIKWEDNIISYGGCCNLVWQMNNGCNNGYNEMLFTGNDLGAVFNNDCTTKPMIFALGSCPQLKFCSDGYAEMVTTMNFLGGVCVGGSSGYSGTFDTSSNTQIFITNGIITGIA